MPYLFSKGPTCCNSMLAPFFQRFCGSLHVSNWLLAAHPFFAKGLAYLFSKGFLLPSSLPVPFFQRLQLPIVCKGCCLPFPHLLPFFQRFLLILLVEIFSNPCFQRGSLFSKGSHFCQEVIYVACLTSLALNSKASALVLPFSMAVLSCPITPL